MNSKIKFILKQAAVIAACLVSFLLIWILALPIAGRFYLAAPKLIRISVICIFSLILLALSQVFTLWFVFMPLMVLEARAALGFVWLRSSSANTKLRLSVGLVLAMALHMSLAYALIHFMPDAWNSELDLWSLKITDYLKSSSQSETLLKGWEDFYKYLPGVYIGSFMAAYFLTYWNTWFLNKIEIPSVFFWTFLFGFCLSFLDFEFLNIQIEGTLLILAKNIFFVCCALYFFQGVAVLNSLFERVKIARFWRNLWYILIILYLPVGLVFMGVADFLFDYREKYKNKRKDNLE